MTLAMSDPQRRTVISGLGFACMAGGSFARGKIMSADRSVAFAVDPSGHIFVHAQISGRNISTVLDSGAGLNVIDAGTARELGLVPKRGSVSAGMTANVASDRVTLPPISLGVVTLPQALVAVADLREISSSVGRKIDLVLGRGFFQDFQVALDFDGSRAILRKSGSLPGVGFSQLPLVTSDNGRLYTQAIVERSSCLDAMYDLGSGVPLYMSSTLAESIGVFEGRPSSQSATVGVEGLLISRIATLRQIRFGGFTLYNVPVQVPDQWNQRGPMTLGLPIWNRFNNVIDIEAGKLWLSPNLTVSFPFLRDRSGIGAQRLRDRLKVIFVAPGSPALAAGLKAGDEIVTVDGVPCGSEFYKARPRPGAETAGTVQSLGLSSGSTLVVTLRDYF